MSCTIRNKAGEVTGVLTDKGAPSELYKSLEREAGEMAEGLYKVSQTSSFKEAVIKPKVTQHINRFKQLLKPATRIALKQEKKLEVQDLIERGEITYTNEEGNLCAASGLAVAGFSLGGTWALVEDLAGEPSHRMGGVDLQIGENGISYKNNQGEDIKAEDGLLIANEGQEGKWEIHETENTWEEYKTDNEWVEQNTWEEIENEWEVVEDLVGEPSHKEGGVDLEISEDGVEVDTEGNTWEVAEEGLDIPNEKLQGGGKIKTEKQSELPKYETPSTEEVSEEEKINMDEYLEGLDKFTQDKHDYYNPEKVKANTGSKIVDFAYNNQGLMKIPAVKKRARKEAERIARQNAREDRTPEQIMSYDKGEEYDGTISSFMGEKTDREGVTTLMDQYFSDEPLYEKSKYTPKSDYLEWLPSYSIKGRFDEEVSKKGDESEYKRSILRDAITQIEGDDGRTYEDFLKDKKPVFSQLNENGRIASLLDVDLGGNKEGLAWDEDKGLPYISVSDAWDFSPGDYQEKWGNKEDKGNSAYVQSALMHKVGNPFKVYDRFYFDPDTTEYLTDEEVDKYKSR